MVIAVTDDLLVRSKIQAAARPLGVPVTFVRSWDELVTEARHAHPALLIVDVRDAEGEPLAIVTRARRDPTLADVPTVVVVAHVRADLVEAARRAGADQVLARSALAARLPALLRSSA